jgi:hypothetical protein
MTDIGNWRDLIEVKGEYSEYTMIPLNLYQIGNLLDALTQAQDTGDWWGELQDILGAAMKKRDILLISSNRGTIFSQEQVLQRKIMSAVKP